METVVHGAAVAGRALVIVAVSLAISCAPPNPEPSLSGNPYLTRAVLERESASALVMPGAEKLRVVGGERFNSIDGPQPAFTGAIWGSAETLARVYDFYRLELSRIGWKEDGDAALTTVDTAGKQWCKPGMAFRLAFIDPHQYDRVGVTYGEGSAIVYDARLQSATGPCPRP